MKTVLLSCVLIAPMLLWGGAAAAQNNSPSNVPGWDEGLREAAEILRKIRRVRIEVSEITVQDYAVGRLFVGFTAHDEDSQIARQRTGYCVRAQVIRGQPWDERCTDENPRCGRKCYGEIEVGSQSGEWMHFTKAQVRVRYYGAGGAYTSWSPEYTTAIRY